MNITFNKTNKADAILSVWEIYSNGMLSIYEIIGEKHSRFGNVYSIYNNKNNSFEVIGSLEKAKMIVKTKLMKGE